MLDGKIALVTGGGVGIGLSIAEQLHAEGAGVVVCGRREKPLRAAFDRLGDRVDFVRGDVAAPGDPKRIVGHTLDRFGRIDIVVNNAGVFSKQSIAETTDDEISRMFDVNVRGTLAMCREASAALRASKGCIVNVTSGAARYVRPGLSAYGGSKASVNHATRLLAAELGPDGIRVNAVAPGLTRTDMTAPIFDNDAGLAWFVENTALRRVGEPEDVARVVVFLVGNDARWVTGQVLEVSGGLLL